MTCRTLALVANEVFGQWIDPPLTGAPVLPTNWNGLQYGPTFPTPTVVGTLTLTVTTRADGGLNVAVGGLPGVASLDLSYANPGTNRRADLLASIFGGGSFLVVRWAGAAIGSTGSLLDPWLFDVVDLRPSATGSSPPLPRPSRFGPLDVQRGVDLKFCPSSNGRLVLLWGTAWGDGSGPVDDRQRIVRTETGETLWDRVGWNSPPSTYRVCRTAPVSGAPFDLQLFPSGQGSSLQPPGAAMQDSRPAPGPGKLALSPQSATLSATSPSQTFAVSNNGGDFLELVSIGASAGAPLTIVVPAAVALPRCLAPNETISFSVTLTTPPPAPATATVNVVTVPAASPAVATLTLNLSATPVVLPRVTLAPDPVQVPSVGGSASLTVFNGGPGAVVVAAAAATGAAVTWPALATTLSKGTGTSLAVTLAAGQSVPPGTFVVVTATLAGTATPVPITPARVSVVAGPPPFPAGLKILGIDFNPFGSDLESESITIGNVSSAAITLDGCRIFDLVFSGSNSSRSRQVFTFPAGTVLAPLSGGTPTLKVMTRARRPGDVQDPLVLYMGRPGPIWNNTGDTATLTDPSGTQKLDTYAYTTKLPSSGSTGGPIFVPPQPRRRILVRLFDVPGNRDWTGNGIVVEDDDVVNIDAWESIWSGVWFQDSTEPDGRPGTAAPDPSNFPMPGFPLYGLIARIGDGDPFFVGSLLNLTVRLSAAAQASGTPQSLEFGINDDQVGDNSGKFVVRVVQYRA